METDYVDFVKSCYDCQTYANLNHVPPSKLYGMTSPWPFLVWGIDVIGRIAPKASNGHKYILMEIDYFTGWLEVAFYFVLKTKHVARFIENNIICDMGYPKRLSPIMVPTLRERLEESWNYTTLSITSLQHIDHRPMGP